MPTFCSYSVKSGFLLHINVLCTLRLIFLPPPLRSRGRTVSIEIRLPGFESWQDYWWDSFLFATASYRLWGPLSPLSNGYGSPSPGIKWPGRETDHSPPSSIEVEKACSYTSTPQYVLLAWCLVTHRENLPLPLPLCFCSETKPVEMNFGDRKEE
jgi:hypothetical protein